MYKLQTMLKKKKQIAKLVTKNMPYEEVVAHTRLILQNILNLNNKKLIKKSASSTHFDRSKKQRINENQFRSE